VRGGLPSDELLKISGGFLHTLLSPPGKLGESQGMSPGPELLPKKAIYSQLRVLVVVPEIRGVIMSMKPCRDGNVV
jgi:hypothetical protein